MMDRIRQELEKGGAVVFPTETVYGLGADGLNPKATKKNEQKQSIFSKKKLSLVNYNIVNI